MSFFSEYSLWYVPLCVIVGGASAFFLYRKDSRFREAPSVIRTSMFVLRALVVSLVLFILLGVFVRRTSITIEKPLVIVLQDNSESVLVTKDSSFYRNEYPSKMRELLKQLSVKYDVEFFRFGKNISPDTLYSFTEKETDISNALDEISTRFYSRNVGAVVLASDGIYTSGKNPYYSVQNLPFSSVLHSIVLGDSIQAKDIVLQEARTNKIVFRDNPFPIKVSVRAYSHQGKTTVLRIFHESKQVFSKPIRITSNDFYHEEMCVVSSSVLGKQIFTVVLDSVDSEISYLNNSAECIVDVLESRQKIAIFYSHIHPDIRAIKHALESNQNYSVELFQIRSFSGSIADFNCVLFYGLPQSDRASQTIVEQVYQKKIPSLFFYAHGMNSEVAAKFGSALKFSQSHASFDEVIGEVDKNFTAFQLRDELQEFLLNVPPVHAPYGSYTLNPEAHVCLWQRMQSITLPRPLLVFQEIDGIKYANFMGEGLWRWRLYANRTQQDAYIFDEFIHTLISYIAIRETRTPFQVSTQQIFEETENVLFSAELYNETFEPIVSEPVYISVQDSAGKEYTYTFTPLERSYALNIGLFPPGKYSYKAHCVFNKKEHVQEGIFLVHSLQKEFTNTKADVSLLRSMAFERGGSTFFPNTMHAIVDSIQQNTTITPVSHSISKQTNILDFISLLFLLVIALAGEWFLRKYYGG